MQIIRDWFRQLFNDPQAIILVLVLALVTGIVLFMGQDLAPVLASIVIAYLLEGIVQILQRYARLPRLPSSPSWSSCCFWPLCSSC